MTMSWQFWAVLSAVFAALTAIFAKLGVEQVNADFATFVRTIVILFGPSARSLADTPLPSPLCQVLPSSRLYSQSAPGFSPVMGIDP